MAVKKLVWLYVAFHYSNALTIRLVLDKIDEVDRSSVKVLIPQPKTTDNHMKDTLLGLTQADATKIDEFKSLEEAKNEYDYKLFSFNLFKSGWKSSHERNVVMEWAANDPFPILTLESTPDVDNREWGNYHSIPNKNNADLRIGPFEFPYHVAGDQNHLQGDEPVYFDFSDVVSHFPKCAYEEVVAHYGGKIKNSLISCDLVTRPNPPIFVFERDGYPVFTFSEANYIVRESDKKCYLAARLSENDDWVIGATLSRTNGIAFQKDGNSEKYILALVTPSKHLAARIL